MDENNLGISFEKILNTDLSQFANNGFCRV